MHFDVCILVFLGSLQKSCFRKAALFLAFMYAPKNGTPGANRTRIPLRNTNQRVQDNGMTFKGSRFRRGISSFDP